MVNNSSVTNLVKILIGAAWIDGRIQPEERQYLRKIAQEKGVANEPEIQPLLHELVACCAARTVRRVGEGIFRPSPESSRLPKSD